MIRTVEVFNYKSIPKLTLELGRVSVLVGANGSGKSNILEAITLASAAADDKLDNEFLISRGIRVTETQFMRSAFRKLPPPPEVFQISIPEDEAPTVVTVPASRESIRVSVRGDSDIKFNCELVVDEDASYPKWTQHLPKKVSKFVEGLSDPGLTEKQRVTMEFLKPLLEQLVANERTRNAGTLAGFLMYAPENSSLRTFQSEGQILPLGIRGEGLFAHLKALNTEKNRSRLVKLKDKLRLIEWYETFEIPDDIKHGDRSIRIRDRFLKAKSLFDQRSANEGFLFLLFYLVLFISPDTPAFFSIDNVESSLNPKLCVALIQQIVSLAKEYDKQVVLTTHNPAILDGLDLHDDEQRLLIVERNKEGHTNVRRVQAPRLEKDQDSVNLSEAFIRGYIGGLPKNF